MAIVGVEPSSVGKAPRVVKPVRPKKRNTRGEATKVALDSGDTWEAQIPHRGLEFGELCPLKLNRPKLKRGRRWSSSMQESV